MRSQVIQDFCQGFVKVAGIHASRPRDWGFQFLNLLRVADVFYVHKRVDPCSSDSLQGGTAVFLRGISKTPRNHSHCLLKRMAQDRRTPRHAVDCFTGASGLCRSASGRFLPGRNRELSLTFTAGFSR